MKDMTNSELLEFIRSYQTTLSFLDSEPCDWYFGRILNRYGYFGRFNPFEIIVERLKDLSEAGLPSYQADYRIERDLHWLISNDENVRRMRLRCNDIQLEDLLTTVCTKEEFFVPQ